MTRILVDTGFLVGLFLPNDRLAAPAARYLNAHRHPLVTVTAAVVEACFFLKAREKADLLTWIHRGGIAVADVPVSAYPAMEQMFLKFADQEIDFVDAALASLGSEIGAHRVLTADRTDFEVLRLKGGRRFEIIEWY